MHELSIAQSLVETATRHAAAERATRVLRVDLRLGTLSGVEVEALRFCFPVAARDTVCEGAELNVILEPARGRCASCGAVSEVLDLLDPCPACGAWPVGVEGGREMVLQSLEVA